MKTMMRQTLRHGEPIVFDGGFGRAEVARKNDLWHVTFDGRGDWYEHLDQACSVAHSLAERGVPPTGAQSLLDRANRRAAQ